MKYEGLLLNIICIILALFFVGLAVLNFLDAGNFISIDSLFFTSVCMLLALVSLINPLMTLKESGALPVPFMRREKADTTTGGTPAALSPAGRPASAIPAARAPAMRDAKGRPMPPDVQKMVAQMSEARQQNPEQQS